MEEINLYKLPKDILVKLIATIREDEAKRYEKELAELREFKAEHVCYLCDEILYEERRQCGECMKWTCQSCGLNWGPSDYWFCDSCAICYNCDGELEEGYYNETRSAICGNCSNPLCLTCAEIEIQCSCGKMRKNCKDCTGKCKYAK